MRTIATTIFLFTLGWASAQTTVLGNIQSGGLTRDYRLYVPAAYTGASPVPLVLNLHGYSSSALEQEFYSLFQPIADTANFLVVHPNGTFDTNGNRFWNALGPGSNVDDVGFLSNLIDSLHLTYNIDTDRIYSTGMSNGGFMSYLLACELQDRIAAIASVTGTMNTLNLNNCQPQRPVPVMEIHGTADNVVPYNGAPLSGFTSVPNVVSFWVSNNNCNPTPILTPVPNTNTTDGCTAEHYLYTGGENGSTVEHYKIIGGGHTWPGALINIGITNQDFSASKEIWRFFNQYRLNILTDIDEPGTITNKHWTAFPNPVQNQLILKSSAPDPARRIRIFDATGRLQRSLSPANENQIRIETAAWERGVYFIVIDQNKNKERLRIVKH